MPNSQEDQEVLGEKKTRHVTDTLLHFFDGIREDEIFN